VADETVIVELVRDGAAGVTPTATVKPIDDGNNTTLAGWPSRPAGAGPGYRVVAGEADLDGFYYAWLVRQP